MSILVFTALDYPFVPEAEDLQYESDSPVSIGSRNPVHRKLRSTQRDECHITQVHECMPWQQRCLCSETLEIPPISTVVREMFRDSDRF